ncbi:DUF3263 domain-containing protein [Rhodococcus opacus]|uniref:DUF3263 domain-containing protein n=1 Tax=Rhodococcus opacus TaxID=37919 RepID=UPI001FF3B5F0|nr:DUF3263 domain-containing protein [Rhodococcus opacus]UOT03840.1 DUF3263 domain-containing protein [Rhodococcus opacus]
MVETTTDRIENQRMLEFAGRWHLLGGGPAEDIMTEFGLAPTSFFQRLLDIVSADNALDLAERTTLLRVCRRRMWVGQ